MTPSLFLDALQERVDMRTVFYDKLKQLRLVLPWRVSKDGRGVCTAWCGRDLCL